MLELNQLTEPVAAMAEAIVGQGNALQDLAERARQALQVHGHVTEELRDKLRRAESADPSWRGADPLGQRLDEQRSLPVAAEAATLIAVDGSQIYPDTHGIALYYLLNVGIIVLRQGSGQAPETQTKPRIFYGRQELYGDSGQGLVTVDEVNYRRDLWETQALARRVVAERQQLGGDLSRQLVALADGPLLPWMPQRLSDTEQRERVQQVARELSALQKVEAAPLGYVDRPRSANLLRLLHLAELKPEEITQERLRRDNPYRELTDRSLCVDLGPGQRSGLFAATSEINRTFAGQDHRIAFCYLNVATDPGRDHARIVRVEVPQWLAEQEERLDAALAAVRADCTLTAYPYVLSRAHELALVSQHERDAFERMLHVELLRHGLSPEESAKALIKRAVGGR